MKPPIVFENVSKYYGDVKALDSVSFIVREGEALALLGPNGSGKSTVVRLSLGLKKPSSGNIKIYGEDPYYSSKIRRKMGFILDKSGIDPLLTASENLSFYYQIYNKHKPDNREVLDALERVGLKEYKDTLTKTFSKGMLRRLEIAKILICDPKILVLDEPFSALDQEGKKLLVNVINEFKEKGASILVSSHEMRIVNDFCDSIALLYNGKILKYGKKEELGNFCEIKAKNIDNLKKIPKIKDIFNIDKNRVIIEFQGKLDELIDALSKKGIRIKEIKELKDILEGQ